jgi:hypothetical protein
MRKYYTKEFNRVTNFSMLKRSRNIYLECLQYYVRSSFGKESKAFGIDELDLVHTMGSLIYPKEMMKSIDPAFKGTVEKIYKHLYSFSFNELLKVINNKSLIFLFAVLIEKKGFMRIFEKRNMSAN